MSASPLTLVMTGQVDHGKSTLIGRLLHDTGSLPDGKVEELRAASARRGVAFEWSFALDALQAERDQAVTLDTTQRWLRLPGRDVLIVDAPGHREFLARMVAGAAIADAALLVVDASERFEAQAQTHAQMLFLLGIGAIVVAVNKMDCVGFAEATYRARAGEITAFFAAHGVAPRAILPVAARDGDNLLSPSPRLRWHRGATLAESLATLTPRPMPAEQALRLPVQDVYRLDQRRMLVGRVETGRLALGDDILLSPSNAVARIRSIEAWPSTQLSEASAGQSIALTLDRPVFVERGEIMSHRRDAPLLTHRFRATLAWLGSAPHQTERAYKLQLGTAEAMVTLRPAEDGRNEPLAREDVADVVIRSARLLALDDAEAAERSGRFVLRDGAELVAFGLIRLKDIADERPAGAPGSNIVPTRHRVTAALRAARFGHRGGVVWLTGLSGAGKSTLAMGLEEHLFRHGYAVYVLDGDNLRGGLNADLGFSPAERAENIRRAGETAALFARAGLICITAFISPYATDRAGARKAAGADFHEVYLDADLATCEARDAKGLYRRARAGEIDSFTGISAPYDVPQAPELVLHTGREPVEACIERLVDYVRANFAVIGAAA